jgi:hypothetical protein
VVKAYLQGCVVPQVRGLTVSKAVVKYSDPETTFSLVYEFRDGTFKSEVLIGQNIADNFQSVIIHSIDLLQTIADTYAFVNGVSLQVVPEIFLVEGSTTGRLVLLGHRQLMSYLKSAPDHNRIVAIRDLAFENREFAFALRDLNQALHTQNYSALAAGRAVEVIRNAFMEDTNDESKGWKGLRENLRVTKSFLTYVTDHSKNPRHGRRIGINGSEQNETLTRAWIIVDRYIDLKTRGKLDETEYPILDTLPEPSLTTRTAVGLQTP